MQEDGKVTDPGNVSSLASLTPQRCLLLVHRDVAKKELLFFHILLRQVPNSVQKQKKNL